MVLPDLAFVPVKHGEVTFFYFLGIFIDMERQNRQNFLLAPSALADYKIAFCRDARVKCAVF